MELDRFLNARLSPEDPVITVGIVHDYIARRGTESESNRAHRLTLTREVCRFLRLEDARTAVLDRRSLRIVHRKFVPRVLSRDEGKRFLQACAELPQGRTSPVRDAVLGAALRLLYLAGLRAGELLRLTQADVGNRHIRLHDLRHSFAVLRLLLWCEQNVDLGAKLPLLATYLGHVGLASSQRYLQLTQDLMGEITRRHQARFGYLRCSRHSFFVISP